MTRRTETRALLLSLTLLAPACSRPPKGLRRLDSGDSNHGFQIDERRRDLFYVEGGGDLATRLAVVNLETGRRGSYRFSPETIVGFRPSFHEDAVTVAVEGSGSAKAGQYELLKVDADSGRVLLREPRATLSGKDFVNFGEPAPIDEDVSPSTGLAKTGSATPEPGDDEGVTFGSKPVGGAHPGVQATIIRGKKRTVFFFPTLAEPDNVRLAHDGKIYASSLGPNDKWKVEELNPSNGVRRTLAEFSGKVESMAYVGQGLALLRRGDDGSGLRFLDMIDAPAGRVALELPWSDGESDILDADTDKRLLFVRMNEGETQTCWSVHFDEPALRAASAYLAKARGSNVRKLTSTDLMALGMLGAMLVFVVGIVAIRD
jgi:hypothetical protein